MNKARPTTCLRLDTPNFLTELTIRFFYYTISAKIFTPGQTNMSQGLSDAAKRYLIREKMLVYFGGLALGVGSVWVVFLVKHFLGYRFASVA